MMPDGEPGHRKFKLVENSSPFRMLMKATLDPESGQVIIGEEGNTVMQYNYKTIYEKDVIHSNNEQLKYHNRTERDTFVTTSI